MNEFRTVVSIPESGNKISYDSGLLFMGSCFSENIGERFVRRSFKTLVNPFGILYNPFSVRQGLDILLERRLFAEEQLFEFNGLWHSFFHHSRFSSVSRKQAVENINKNIIAGHEYLKQADFLFMTFGTAWVYEHIESKKIVANCHKLPSAMFKRFRLGVTDVVSSFNEIINRLKTFNPGLRIIFTVSPVRHWKDGAHGNQLSKSVLHLAIDVLTGIFGNVEYFPAYELVIDDLRDYRFYDEDMLHPGNQAVKYIWERLGETYFDQKAGSFAREMTKVINARNHRPFNRDSDEYRKFAYAEIKRLEKIKEQYPNADIRDHFNFFKKI